MRITKIIFLYLLLLALSDLAWTYFAVRFGNHSDRLFLLSAVGYLCSIPFNVAGIWGFDWLQQRYFPGNRLPRDGFFVLMNYWLASRVSAGPVILYGVILLMVMTLNYLTVRFIRKRIYKAHA